MKSNKVGLSVRVEPEVMQMLKEKAERNNQSLSNEIIGRMLYTLTLPDDLFKRAEGRELIEHAASGYRFSKD